MKTILATALLASSLLAGITPAQAASCSTLKAQRGSYMVQADAAFNRGSYAVAKSLLKLADSKNAELRAKGCN